VILDPGDPSRLYLYDVSSSTPGEPTIFASVFVSSDKAQTWSGLIGTELDWAKAVFHAAPRTPAAAIEAAAAFLADFDGAVNNASSGAQVGVSDDLWGGGGEVVIDRDDPSVLYVPTERGVYKSMDQGATWNQASVGMTDSNG
jgi:hypothetical protein